LEVRSDATNLKKVLFAIGPNLKPNT